KACGVYAYLVAGTFVDEDAVAGVVPALERGCELDDGRSCTMLGQVHLYGIGKKAQLAEGARMLEKACELGDGEGCMHSGAAMPDNLPRSRARIRERYEQACIAGTHGACALLGQVLIGMGASSLEAKGWIRALYVRDCRHEGMNELCVELEGFIE
ncbi:MAG: hypothetical protein ACNA8W_22150, partial [Bradymonadaceae bacterium]